MVILVIGAEAAPTLVQLEFLGGEGTPPHPQSVLIFKENMLWRAKARHNKPKHVQAC